MKKLILFLGIVCLIGINAINFKPAMASYAYDAGIWEIPLPVVCTFEYLGETVIGGKWDCFDFPQPWPCASTICIGRISGTPIE